MGLELIFLHTFPAFCRILPSFKITSLLSRLVFRFKMWMRMTRPSSPLNVEPGFFSLDTYGGLELSCSSPSVIVSRRDSLILCYLHTDISPSP